MHQSMVMNKRVFLDVNIVVDILDTKRKGHVDTKKLLNVIYKTDIEIVISEDMLSTIFYIVKVKNAVLNFFKVIQRNWVVSSFGDEVVKKSIELALRESVDFEDVLQCLCAKQNQCDSLITNDNKFVDCGLSVCTVEEYLNEKIV